VDEVCELVDRTDAVCRQNTRLLKADGSDSPISVVVANTYNQVRPADGQGLVASYVATAFEDLDDAPLQARRTRCRARPSIRCSRRLVPWGRLYLATLSVDPWDPQNQADFAMNTTLTSPGIRWQGQHQDVLR
jgi:hypothetical protein